MNIKLLFKSLLVTCLFFVAASLLPINAVAAPRLYFDPTSSTPKKGDDFTITIKIDVETQTVFGADSTVVFPSNDLDVKSVGNGGYFNNFTYAQSDGRLELHGFVSQAASKTGAGDFAKITFNAKKDSGSGAIGFICTTNDETQIYGTDGSGILNCNNINPVSVTYTGDSGYPPGYSEPNKCGGTCGSNYNCAAPLFCYDGYCRNPDCRTDLTCGCKATPTPTKKATPKPISKAGATPEVVTLAEYTPFPSSTPPLEETPIQTTRGGLNVRTFGILTGIGILIVALILMLLAKARKKNPPKINPPTTLPDNPMVGYPPPPPPPSPTPPPTI